MKTIIKEKNGNRSYLEALTKLRKFVDSSYKDGGWLPASREMCEKFKVNRKTYSKALQCLDTEGVAHSYPKKGHYVVPEFLRAKKIGIIIGDAGDSPFIQSDEVLCAVLAILRENDFCVQLMQAADLNNILDKALIHGVKGLIWLLPSEDKFAHIKTIDKRSELPIVIASFAGLKKESRQGLNVVTMEPSNSDQIKVDFFVKRNHKKIAIIGRANIETKITEKLIFSFKKDNVASFFIPHDLNGKVANLAILAKDPTITGLIIDGGASDHYKIFDVLSKLKKLYLRDIYVHDTEQLKTIRSMYPKIKITVIGNSNNEVLGKTTATILMDYLLKDKTLISKKVGSLKLTIVK